MAAALHERATSLAVATISLNAVLTSSTASRWRPAAWFILLATALVSAAAVCRSEEALPMRCTSCAIMLRNWLNQPARLAVSSLPCTLSWRVRSPSPSAISCRPSATPRIGRTITRAKLAPTIANTTASTAAIAAINHVRRVAPAITSSRLIRPIKRQPKSLELTTLAM
ncbi:hypothetical protein PFLmoz3_00578 [Pseudomonas fluorescens]|uniref:Uncharacterized protein n=1 Tax=Pseudomonas fluorescens TaxID=294 RepID=A0A120G919_PSEFL|nr:hypothetical protein PFLmoz3_00578 [Pseudomonas fluorescens]